MDFLDKLWPGIAQYKIKYLMYTLLIVAGIYWIAFAAGATYAMIESICLIPKITPALSPSSY